MNIIEKRWERIRILEVDFNYIKNIVRDKFGYEVSEISLNDFIDNIEKYKNINIDLLLSYIEKNYYSKLSILTMRQMKNEPNFPVHEELTNAIFNHEFKRKNRINLQNNEEYIGELDDLFKIIYYKETSRYVEIKMARIFSYSSRTTKQGVTHDFTKNLYDCFKIIIDLEEKLVFMFYNDLPVGNMNNGYEYTYKKKVFYELFTCATKGNILSFIISDTLTQYFLEYMQEVEVDDIKKRISSVEAINLIGARKATRSISHECNHEKCSIDAIKTLILEKNYCISALECTMKSNLIKLKNVGEIIVQIGMFSKEVLEIVCREFIKGHRVYEFCDI